MKVVVLAQKITKKFSEKGFRGTFKELFMLICDALLVHKYIIFYAPLHKYKQNFEFGNGKTMTEIDVLEVSPDRYPKLDLAELVEYGGNDLAADFSRRFDKGGRLFVGKKAGKISTVAWVFPGKARKYHYVPLSERDFSISHCFTLPKYRRQGLYGALLAKILGIMKKDGFENGYIACKVTNIASKLGIINAGFQILAHAKLYSLFKKNIIIWED